MLMDCLDRNLEKILALTKRSRNARISQWTGEKGSKHTKRECTLIGGLLNTRKLNYSFSLEVQEYFPFIKAIRNALMCRKEIH